MTSKFKRPVRAVVLAAGHGKRMKSDKSKVLHEVLGRAIITRVLDSVDGLGAEHAHVVVGHAADQVEAHLASAPPATPYSTHMQQPQLGTGHALMQAAPALEHFSGTIVVLVGDAPLLKASTLENLVNEHQNKNAVVSLLTTHVEDAKSYGRIVRNAAGSVEKIVEDKDCTADQRQIKEINPAIYCLEWPAVKEGLAGLKNDNNQKEYYLTDLVGWASTNKHNLSSTSCDWREVSAVNSRLELAEVVGILKDEVVRNLCLEQGVTVIDPSSTFVAPEVVIGKDSVLYPGCVIFGSVKIGENCTIGPHSQITGPVQVGNNCQIIQSVVSKAQIADGTRIGPFAHLRDGVTLADHCRIGNFVEIKASEIGSHTNVSHLSYVGDAQVGSDANLGAGTITANYDKLTGKKSKTIIGSCVSTGSNSVLVAPVVLGDEAVVGAGSVITKDVPAGSLAVSRARQENKEGWVKRKKAGKVSV